MNGTGAMGTVFALAAMLAACDRVPAEAEAEAEDRSVRARRGAGERAARPLAVASLESWRADREVITSAA